MYAGIGVYFWCRLDYPFFAKSKKNTLFEILMEGGEDRKRD